MELALRQLANALVGGIFAQGSFHHKSGSSEKLAEYVFISFFAVKQNIDIANIWQVDFAN